MAMNTERSSKPLHNFAMPGQLRWGNRRFLRCMKVNSDGQISAQHLFNSAATDSHYNQNHHHHHRRWISIQNRRTEVKSGEIREASCDESHKLCSTPPSPADHGIAAFREKVLFDIQAAGVKMKDSILKGSLEEGEASIIVSPPPQAVADFPAGESRRPWSLRTRRAAGKTTPPSAGVVTGSVSCGGPNPGLQPTRLRSGGDGAEGVVERDREKFSVALSKRAIEEDFMTMVNHWPPRRPKKRPKIIQKQLDMLFPGMWLTEVTADMYKVTEPAP